MEDSQIKKQKQNYLKSEVIEKGYSQEVFIEFISNRKKSGFVKSP
jgi:hypothetical protein